MEKWAASAIERGIIPFGHPAVDHQACLVGDWDRVRDQLAKMGRTAGGVSQGLRELKELRIAGRHYVGDNGRWRVASCNAELVVWRRVAQTDELDSRICIAIARLLSVGLVETLDQAV